MCSKYISFFFLSFFLFFYQNKLARILAPVDNLFESNSNCIILRKLEYCFFNGSKSGQWFRRAAFLALAVYSILHPQVSFSDSISNFQFFKFCLISKRWRWQWRWRWRWRWRFTQTRWVGFRLRTTHVRKAVLPTKADTFWRNVIIRW